MKYLFYAIALVLAIYFMATGDDIRSDIYTAVVRNVLRRAEEGSMSELPRKPVVFSRADDRLSQL